MGPSKTYSGRFIKGLKVVRVRAGSVTSPLRCLNYFTPTFGWGFHGSASEELAIAILHDHLESQSRVFQERVLQLYRPFVEDVVAKFDRDSAWSLGENAVAKWIRQQEKAAVAS